MLVRKSNGIFCLLSHNLIYFFAFTTATDNVLAASWNFLTNSEITSFFSSIVLSKCMVPDICWTSRTLSCYYSLFQTLLSVPQPTPGPRETGVVPTSYGSVTQHWTHFVMVALWRKLTLVCAVMQTVSSQLKTVVIRGGFAKRVSVSSKRVITWKQIYSLQWSNGHLPISMHHRYPAFIPVWRKGETPRNEDI